MAEEARYSKEKAALEADIIVKAEIRKKELELSAEAEAEQTRRRAKGEADAIFMKMQAQASGIQEILLKQASGFEEMVKASGGKAEDAIRLLIADKLEDLMKVQVDAIKNIKIDKVTVWDGGNTEGKSATANFVSSLFRSVPPLNEMFDMAGMKLPNYLGTPAGEKDENKTETRNQTQE
jgi:flotillin